MVMVMVMMVMKVMVTVMVMVMGDEKHTTLHCCPAVESADG